MQQALNWIKIKKPLLVFIRNRLNKITSKKNVDFSYIHIKENPSDLPSRGLSSNNLEGSSLWWKGLEWLKHDQISWPTWNMPDIDKKRLKNIQSKVRWSKTLYKGSAIAQGKHVFPNTANKVLKTDVTLPFENWKKNMKT